MYLTKCFNTHKALAKYHAFAMNINLKELTQDRSKTAWKLIPG